MFFQRCACVVALSFFMYTHTHAERKVFTFSANSTSANLAEGKEFTKLSGNAEVTADDVRIRADEIELYGDDFQFAEVSGRFEAYDIKNDFVLEGNSLFYDRQEKLLRAEGNIIMKDNKNDLIIRASFLESKEDGKFMVVQLGVRMTKKDELSARSEFVTYYRETDEIEMSGFPYALWKDDEYSANRITINLETDEVQLSGKVTGSISTKAEDEETEAEDKETGGEKEDAATSEEKQNEQDKGTARDKPDADAELKSEDAPTNSVESSGEAQKSTGAASDAP